MPDDPTLTLALVLTAAGATASAALVSGLVQLLKQIAPLSGREKLAAFVLSAALVILAMAAGIQAGTLTLSIATGFGGFLAWYGIARLSMAVYDDVSGTDTPGSLRTP